MKKWAIISLLLLGATLSFSDIPVVSDIDFLMASQSRMELHRNRATTGKPLSIAKTKYKTGLGTHAVSEIPVTVPPSVISLSGKVGVDDSAGRRARVLFRILSGNKILWTSKVLSKGNPAESFKVALPQGCSKLYLQVDSQGSLKFDYADWVDLKWGESGKRQTTPEGVAIIRQNIWFNAQPKKRSNPRLS